VSDSGFLYRRLARLAPCVLPSVGIGGLALRDKYIVASARDVFLSAQYWRLFEFLETPPKLVVDLGAHCGHFAVLLHLLLLEKFRSDSAKYFLVEPAPKLVETIRQTLDETGLTAQSLVLQGLVGKRNGHATFSAPSNNWLAGAVTTETSRASGDTFPYLDLDAVLDTGPIDVLKVDVEGSEYELVDTYPNLFERARIVTMELHGEKQKRTGIENRLAALGLHLVSTPIERGGEKMILLRRADS
jgi:FkbM family methyltransferase